MEKGIVSMKRGNRVVALTNHKYIVFDLTDGNDVDIGDEITGRLNSLGAGKVTNLTKKQTLSVHFEDIQATKYTAQFLLMDT